MSNLWPEGDAFRYISPPPSDEWQKTFPRKLLILGSTGSIGRNALSVVAKYPDLFSVLGLSCSTNVELLARQAEVFRPAYLSVGSPSVKDQLQAILPKGYHPHIFVGEKGFEEFASLLEATTVLSCQSGGAGLSGTLAALLAGKVVCLANKESLVVAGNLVRAICWRTGASILPVDSEHNALFQCLAGRADDCASLLLTASGGPFREKSVPDLESVTVEEALNHPNWSMGKKISIDSATMMNKGLEVIEAYHLYGMPVDSIEVLIHPQSVIHSMIRLKDGSVLAQLAQADMKLPLAHCLLWPLRSKSAVPHFDFTTGTALTFKKPDFALYPCLQLALSARAQGDDACIVLNTANEEAVHLFLQGRIRFTDIARFVSASLTTVLCEVQCTPCLFAPDKGTDDRSGDRFMASVAAYREHIRSLEKTTREFVRSLL